MIGTYSTNFGNAAEVAAMLRGHGLEVKYSKYFFGCATGVAGRKIGPRVYAERPNGQHGTDRNIAPETADSDGHNPREYQTRRYSGCHPIAFGGGTIAAGSLTSSGQTIEDAAARRPESCPLCLDDAAIGGKPGNPGVPGKTRTAARRKPCAAKPCAACGSRIGKCRVRAKDKRYHTEGREKRHSIGHGTHPFVGCSAAFPER